MSHHTAGVALLDLISIPVIECFSVSLSVADKM